MPKHGTSGAYDTAPANTTVTGENDISTEMTFTIEKISMDAGIFYCPYVPLQEHFSTTYPIQWNLHNPLRVFMVLMQKVNLRTFFLESAEILAEINREVVRRDSNFLWRLVRPQEKTTVGIFDLDTDSNGRWMVEKFKGLMMQIEIGNQIKLQREHKEEKVILS